MIKLTFECGDSYESTGKEVGRPACPKCGAALARVEAPKPTIRISSVPYAQKFE